MQTRSRQKQKQKVPLVVVAALIALFAASSGGCATTDSELPTSKHRIRFWLEPSHTEILVGEETTVTSRSTNTVGRETVVEWHATGGELNELQDGRIARVTFNDPGTYTITGTLFVDETEIDTESIHIRVMPLS